MAYVSKVWVDRQTEYPTRRKLAFDDGTGDKIVTVSREEGQIYEAGDIFDANTMNTLESRIAAGIAEKQDILIPGNGIRIDQDNVISATGGGGGIEFTKIESGSLVSVNDAADLPVVDLAVEIKATQSGTGDPSPSNVRPISGFTGLNLYRTGSNVWDEEWELGNIDSNTGAPIPSNNVIRTKNFISIKPDTQYFAYVTGTGTSTFRTRFYDRDKNYIGSTQKNGNPVEYNSVFTSPVNAYYMKFTPQIAYGTTYQNDISINYPATDRNYHPYTGTVIPITWQTEAGTVYGANLGVTRGALNVSWFKFVGDDITSVLRSGAADGNTTFFINFATNDFPAGVSNTAISSQFSRNTASGEGRMTHGASGIFFVVATSRLDSDTAAGGLQWLQDNDVEFCYELAQPVTVQLTPTEIETLLGINNIWADSGDILNLEYYTQSASDVRDFIIKDEEVTDDASWSSEKIQDELDAKQETLTAGDGIVFDGNEISAVLYKELTATLNVFSTSVVFEDASITTSSVIDIYTSKYGFNPETVTAETGRLTLTFRQPDEQITVKVRIS